MLCPKAALATAALALTACMHATVETGLTPSTTVYQKGFASSWIVWLVPPSTLETQAKCPNGVAKVETQASFVNVLVTWLTSYIYSPMSIKVTCAQGAHASLPPSAPEVRIAPSATPEQIRDALQRAAEIAWQIQEPVYLLY